MKPWNLRVGCWKTIFLLKGSPVRWWECKYVTENFNPYSVVRHQGKLQFAIQLGDCKCHTFGQSLALIQEVVPSTPRCIWTRRTKLLLCQGWAWVPEWDKMSAHVWRLKRYAPFSEPCEM